MSCGCAKNRFSSRARARVTLQTLTISDDGYGGQNQSYTNLMTVWAVVEPMAGREIYVSGQLQSRVDARMLIRYVASLADTSQTAKMRVVHNARVYNVDHIANLDDDLKTEGKVYQRLTCNEGKPS